MKKLAACLTLVLLSGCLTQEKKAIDSGVSARLSEKSVLAKSTCSSNQVMVVDGRLAGDSAGIVSGMDASMSSAPSLLSQELARAGVAVGAIRSDETTEVVLKRIYLDQSYEAKKVNIVLEVRAPGMPSKIIRVSETSIMWWGNSEESEKAMARVFQNTVRQLVTHLNSTCSKV